MKKIRLILWGLLFLTAFVSCGKITQIPVTIEENKSFDLTYSVSIVPTENIRMQGQMVSISGFTTMDNTVYARVMGFRKTARQQDELSWGKAVLLPSLKTDNATMNVGVRRSFKSQAFRKDGLDLAQADHTWTKLELDPSQLSWKISSKKLERNYSLYMIGVYSKDKVAFKIVPEAIVSANKTVDIGFITPYDTFISILFLMNWEDSTELGDTELVEKLRKLYPPSFFSQLGYKPKNYAKRFDPASPVFLWEGPLEKNLVKIFYLSRKSKPVALTFIQRLSTDILPEKAKDSLALIIQKL